MDIHPFFKIDNQQTAFIATALHDGHFIDEPLKPYLILDEQGRAREEDPYTWYIIRHLPISKIKVSSSRFQLDLNRTKDKCIYKTPEDAWGLKVWNHLPESLIEKLYQDYDLFYNSVFELVEQAINTHGYALILDVHSYNHRREQPEKQAPQETNPEINIGTAYNHPNWSDLFSSYTDFLNQATYLGHRPDARQNIIFKGGGFAQQLIKKYGKQCGVLSLEFKKTFMDEWTGVADIGHVLKIGALLTASLDFLQHKIVASGEHYD